MSFVSRVCTTTLLVGVLQACQEAAVSLVTDDAELLTDQQESKLTLHHQVLLLDHDIDYRVVTASGVDEIDLAALELFKSLAAGSRSDQGRGLLLLLDSERQEVRLEVGYSLEGVFPDAFVAYVEQRQMVPFFVAGRISDGILASTELIVDRAQKASLNAAWDDEIWIEGSGGAGARSSTHAAPEFETRPKSPSSILSPVAERSPNDVIAAYLDAMRRRDKNPALDIYTQDTRQMMSDWLVTPAQMDQIASTYAACGQGELLHNHARNRAVVRYPIVQRQCAPWFLERSAQGWQLDLTMLQRSIRFGRGNAWHFDLSQSHPYEFGFEDWTLDPSGFPIRSSEDD
jgi:uncharacterized protein